MEGRTHRRVISLVVTLGAVMLVAGPTAVLTAAPTTAALGQPVFRDPDHVEITDEPGQLAFVGAGGDALSYLALSDAGLAASEYGFDEADADPSRFASRTPYPAAAAPQGEVSHTAVGVLGTGPDAEVFSAVIVRDGPGAAWRLEVTGPQARGYRDRHVVTLNGFGEPRGLAVLQRKASEDPFIVVADADGYYPVRVASDGDGGLQLADAVARRTAPGEPGQLLTIATSPSWERLPGQLPSGVAELQDEFLFFVTRATSPGGPRPVIWTAALGDAGQFVAGDRANLAGQLGELDVSGDAVQLEVGWYERNPPAPIVERAGIVLALSNGTDVAIGTWRVGGQGWQWGNRAGLQDCPGDVDFTTFQPAGQTTPSHPYPSWRLVCSAAVGDEVAVTIISGGKPDAVATNDGPTVTPTRAIARIGQAPAGTRFVDPQAHVTLPCVELQRVRGEYRPDGSFGGNDCSASATEDADTSPGDLDLLELGSTQVLVLAGLVDDDDPATRRSEASSSMLVATTHVRSENAEFLTSVPEAADEGTLTNSWQLPLEAGGAAPTSLARLPQTVGVRTVIDLDARFDGCRLPRPDPTCPTDHVVDARPMPIALLLAPPQVAGIGQEVPALPSYASSTSASQTTGTTAANRVGLSIGASYDDPLGMHGFAASIGYERETEQSSAATVEVTRGDAYLGAEDADTLVVQTLSSWHLHGTVVESSTGLGFEEPFDLLVPRVAMTRSLSWAAAQTLLPDEFGSTGPYHEGIERILTHTIGDPGSYPSFGSDGQAIDDLCVGSIDGTEPLGDIGSFDAARPNPFTSLDAPPSPQNAIEVSSLHRVTVGSGGGEGASIEIANGESRSYLETHSVDAEVVGKFFYVSIGASAGATWGSDWEVSVSDGVAFESYVGHVPDDSFVDEGYDWRMFLCKVDLGVPDLDGRLPISVLGYTVDGYEGSGGLEPVGAPSVLGPRFGAETTRAPQLSFEQPTGTVRSWTVEVEGVGTDYQRSFPAGSWPTPADAIAGRPTGTIEQQVGVAPDALLPPGVSLRWRVVAEDFLGNQHPSAWAFFRTDGASDGTAPPVISLPEEPTWTPVPQSAGGLIDAPTVSVHSPPMRGTVDLDPDEGTFLYTPAPGECGSDRFTLRLTDGTLVDDILVRVDAACPSPGDVGGGDDDGGDDGGDRGAQAPPTCDGVVGVGFPDVAAGTVHAAAVGCAAALGLVEGKVDGRFDPLGDLTRGQLATVLARSLRASGVELAARTYRFTDVAGTTHEDAIARLAAAGIVEGRTPTRFDPGAKVTRGQLMTMLDRASARLLAPYPPVSGPRFGDTRGDVHAGAVDRLASAGIARGLPPDGRSFGPARSVSRGQLASFVTRWLDDQADRFG